MTQITFFGRILHEQTARLKELFYESFVLKIWDNLVFVNNNQVLAS